MWNIPGGQTSLNHVIIFDSYQLSNPVLNLGRQLLNHRAPNAKEIPWLLPFAIRHLPFAICFLSAFIRVNLRPIFLRGYGCPSAEARDSSQARLSRSAGSE